MRWKRSSKRVLQKLVSSLLFSLLCSSFEHLSSALLFRSYSQMSLVAKARCSLFKRIGLFKSKSLLILCYGSFSIALPLSPSQTITSYCKSQGNNLTAMEFLVSSPSQGLSLFLHLFPIKGILQLQLFFHHFTFDYFTANSFKFWNRILLKEATEDKLNRLVSLAIFFLSLFPHLCPILLLPPS